MTSLPIIWQRLVSSDGKTCDRCDATYQAIQGAFSTLKETLRPLGIEPTLETRAIDEQSFKANPSESNRIWIAGKPLEEWPGARVGSSRCCSVCGDSECRRTVEVVGTTFEAIPEKLFLKAALIASAQLLDPTMEVPSREGEYRCREAWPKIEEGGKRGSEPLISSGVNAVMDLCLSGE